jgi:hypothetical protein
MINILLIPEKMGKNGHPKIIITSYEREQDYRIVGECGDFGYHEIHEDEQKGINIVLERISNNLSNRL